MPLERSTSWLDLPVVMPRENKGIKKKLVLKKVFIKTLKTFISFSSDKEKLQETLALAYLTHEFMISDFAKSNIAADVRALHDNIVLGIQVCRALFRFFE